MDKGAEARTDDAAPPCSRGLSRRSPSTANASQARSSASLRKARFARIENELPLTSIVGICYVRLTSIPAVPERPLGGQESARDRDRGTPRDATPPTPPGIRVRTNGGSTELGLGGRIDSEDRALAPKTR